MRQIWLLAVLMAYPCAGMADAERIHLAEYRADRDWKPEHRALLLGGTARMYAAEDTYVSASPREPLFSTLHEISSVWLQPLSLGSREFMAELDFKFRQTLRGDQSYSRAQSVRVGPRFSLSPGAVLRFYYGISQEFASTDTGFLDRDVDSERSSTGIAQTWYIGSWDTELELGYEYEQGLGEASYEGVQGHRINLSGRFPLPWGFNADVEAGISRHVYPDYRGVLDLQSDRLSFIAGISRPFGQRLSGSLRYLYADEEFGDTPVEYRRHAWGLNLRYRY